MRFEIDAPKYDFCCVNLERVIGDKVGTTYCLPYRYTEGGAREMVARNNSSRASASSARANCILRVKRKPEYLAARRAEIK